MKTIKITLVAMAAMLSFVACKKDNNNGNAEAGVKYEQQDQMARPAINTVFNAAPDKQTFNETTPSAQAAAFGAKFNARLLALNPGYTTNALGLDASTFTGILSTDVLNVSLNGKTTFFDGTNVLTGRALNDDVIDAELTLIFGGPTGASNPGLTSDHVNANDKPFLTSFPYLATPN
ncbi:MAG: DUF4331 family protein [Sphingobacteriales bacterium]|nr:DUF4331 family protein [Sphingobacteriales bacterium]